MAEEREVLYSGGCQCGGVRYALYAEPYGNAYLPLPYGPEGLWGLLCAPDLDPV